MRAVISYLFNCLSFVTISSPFMLLLVAYLIYQQPIFRANPNIPHFANLSSNYLFQALFCFFFLSFWGIINITQSSKGGIHMDIRESITSNIKRLRKESGLTQQQVADKVNVSRSAYSQYEMGLKQPTIDTLVKIADLYKCSLDYLVGRYNWINKKRLDSPLGDSRR